MLFRSQGFPDHFKIPVSDTQAYKQFGNSIVVPLIENVAGLLVQKVEELDIPVRQEQGALDEEERQRMVV